MFTPFLPFSSIIPTKHPQLVPPQQPIQNKVVVPDGPPEANLPRCLNYYADYSGCGFWRLIWPEFILNAYQKLVVHGSTFMIIDERYYGNVKSVRIQRQATEHQFRFVQFLKHVSEQNKMRIIYEIDDVIFHEDIPEYN